MTDLETAIMIKNMARETVRQMSAKMKNADDTKDKVRALLIKWGNNSADVEKLLTKNYEWAASRYDSVRTIAEAVRTVTTKNATSLKEGDKVRKKKQS